MTHKYDGYSWIVRLQKGDQLIENLTTFIKKEEIKGAWISGLGGALSATLGFYDLEKQEYIWQDFNELMEITSLQGNIAWKGDEPALHIHGTFTKADFSAIGGHVKELVVSGTCEVLLYKWRGSDGLTRTLDDVTGLTTLDV